MRNNRLIVLIPVLFIIAISAYLFFWKRDQPVEKQLGLANKEISVIETYQSPISIDYLRKLNIQSDVVQIEQELADGSNYKRYIASYLSEGNKVSGLLTVPIASAPEGGFSAIVFGHGYIPPKQYVTTEGYVAYVDYLARNGFVVFKIDFRGNGQSEGDASGSYFSSAYSIDLISALKSLQKFEPVNPGKIGIWGHSMAGNAVLRAMEVSDDIKAGVIWAGAVYSYKDFATYGISDSSYVHRPDTSKEGVGQRDREVSPEIQKIRSDPKSIDFKDSFWTSISLTENINHLVRPLQIHHAVNDSVVDIDYSRDLVQVLSDNEKTYEFYEYDGGGHNISSPYFETAMERTVKFFKDTL